MRECLLIVPAAVTQNNIRQVDWRASNMNCFSFLKESEMRLVCEKYASRTIFCRILLAYVTFRLLALSGEASVVHNKVNKKRWATSASLQIK